MREQLKLLVEVQNVDLKILELTNMRDAFPARLREHTAKLDELLHAVEAQKSGVEQMETERRAKEGAVSDEVEKLKKWESRLHEIKTNREYQALQREIELARKANSDTESEILELMSAIEDARGHIAQMEKDLAELQKENDEIKAETDRKTAELDAKVAAEQAERDVMAEKLGQVRLMQRYDTIRKRRQGIAVVRADGGYCHGCQMSLPPQLYHTIIAGSTIETCPSCTRLLFVDGES